jgi:hypothetical protein
LAATSICTEVSGSGNDDTNCLWIPVVMQWNFTLRLGIPFALTP